jgi:hypothetical protein
VTTLESGWTEDYLLDLIKHAEAVRPYDQSPETLWNWLDDPAGLNEGKIQGAVRRMAEADEDDFETKDLETEEEGPWEVNRDGNTLLVFYEGFRLASLRTHDPVWTEDYLLHLIKKADAIRRYEESPLAFWDWLDNPRANSIDEGKIQEIVRRVAEDEEDFETKGLEGDVTVQCRAALEAAGFTVIQAEQKEGELFLKFSWPAINAVTYIAGARRAKEILSQLMELDLGDWHGLRQGNVAYIFLVKKLTEP